jgi:hypothetical protein
MLEWDDHDVISFLRGLRLNGRDYARNKRFSQVEQNVWSPGWTAEPENRMREDHADETWPDAYYPEEEWFEQYAQIIESQVQRALDRKFGRREFNVQVDEKGYVDVAPRQKLGSARAVHSRVKAETQPKKETPAPPPAKKKRKRRRKRCPKGYRRNPKTGRCVKKR